jgi:hypothetical protein
VEATSVTPFSPRAVDRGLAGLTVALARHGHAGMTFATHAVSITTLRPQLAFVADVVAQRAEAHDSTLPAADVEAAVAVPAEEESDELPPLLQP